MKRLTMRSSSEWNDTTIRRPAGASSRLACSSARSISPSSSFTRMRSAWKLRVAGIDAGSIRRQHAADDGGEARGRDDRGLGAGRDDGAGDAARGAFLAEFEQQIGKFAFRQRVDQIGRGRSAAAHAHVQRAIAAEREAARRIVELERRHAEVQHHAVQRGDAALCQQFQHVAELAVDQVQAAGEARDQAGAARDRLGIAIDRPHRAGRRFQDAAAYPPPPNVPSR